MGELNIKVLNGWRRVKWFNENSLLPINCLMDWVKSLYICILRGSEWELNNIMMYLLTRMFNMVPGLPS